MTDGQERVRLRAREGEAVEWTRRVAQQAGTLKDMMDDAPTEDGVYPVPMIAAAELAVLREMCEADSMPARLEQCSISELFRLVEGASFLDAPRALNHAQCALGTRLNGKCANELRELLGATEGFGNADERVAALAEPAFSPEGQLSEATVGSAGGAPALLQPQPSLSGMAVTDDAKEVALGMVDVGTLVELKGVSQSWLALARRVLCSRLSRCEGQPAPTQMAEITDLNIKVLVDAGRPWEAAAAGRMLPNLARLRWEGFEVSVAAVREVDLDERDEDEDEEEGLFFGGPAERPRRAWKLLGSYTALLSCIEGEGEPPLELLLAAVACAGSGEIRGIPVQMMRDDSVSELDLQKRNIGVEGGMLLAYLVPVMGVLTVTNLLGNQLDAESAKMLTEVAKQKGISLCGIRRDQTAADFCNKRLQPPDAILLASDLSQAVVTGALTSVKLRGNTLGDEGWGAIFAAICGNKDSKIMSLDSSCDNISPAGVKLITEALRMSVTGALTSVDLRGNRLGDEGWGAIFAAICGNKDSKIMSLGAASENISPAGVKLITEALRTSVTGALTLTNLLGNQLDAKSAKMLAEVAKQKGISLCGIRRDQTAADFSSQDRNPRDAILLASDLSQAIVTGALTSVDLGGNTLGDEGWGAIFAAICGNKDSKIMSLDAASENISPAGVKLITEALRTSVTGALTLTNLLGNQLDAKSAKMLAEVAKQKGISLCGIRRDQTTAVFFGKGLQPPDAILLASDLSQAVVTGGLTKMSLANNKLGEEGTKAICEALEQNKTLKELDISGSFYGGSNIGGSAGVKHVAKMLGVNGGLTALNLSSNRLDDEGVSAVCKAIQNNKETKLASLNFENNGISPVGANAVTAMVAVTGGLTSLDLSSNQLCGLDYHHRGTYTAVGITAIADALRVNGGLTKLSLARNHLEEEGTKAICEALEQNTTLKELDIRGSNIGGSAGAKHVAKMVGINGALTEVR